MSVVPSPMQPNMRQVGLGAVLELIGVLVVILPGLLEHGEVRLRMPWIAIGGALVVIGSIITVKAILDARRAGV